MKAIRPILLLCTSLVLSAQPSAPNKVAEPIAPPLPPVLAGAITQAEFTRYSEAKRAMNTDPVLSKNQTEQQALLQQLFLLQQQYQTRETQLLSTTPELAAIDVKIKAALKPHHP